MPRFVRLAVMFGVLVVGQVVKAETCGHYLFRNGLPVSVQGHSVVPEVIPVVELGSDQRLLSNVLYPENVEGQTPHKLPCNSPSCRGQSTPLAPSPVPTTLTRHTDPALLLAEILVNKSVLGPSALPESDSGEYFIPAGIFRPPQA